MKLLKYLTTFALIATSTIISAESPGMLDFGKSHFINQHIEKINRLGAVTIEGVTVTDSAKIMGNLNVKHSFIEQLIVIGNTWIYNTRINKSAELTGGVNIDKGEFFGTLTLTTENAIINHSKTQNIIVKKTAFAVPTLQTLYLNNTLVDGSIIFESGKGKVILSPDSKITGQVEGLIDY